MPSFIINNRLLIFCTVVTIFFSGNQVMAQFSDPAAHAEFYIDTYGSVDHSEFPLAERAQSVFARLVLVAEDPRDVTPGLRIIKSGGEPWAIALPDGIIILSKAAIEICYKNVPREMGDARLAFVLGHELAHLTSQDFWHREIYLSLSGEKNDASLQRIREIVGSVSQLNNSRNWREGIKRKELKADDAGFLYASLAGYRTDLILTEDQNDFLTYWVKQTRTYKDNLHFGPTERSAFLRSRFSSIADKTELFKSGLQLAHFGRLEDAATLFESFRKSFPAHEVLNNLGYVYIELARKHMPNSMRNHFWLPTVLENAPELLSRELKTQTGLPKISQTHLKRAVKYLKAAINSHRENFPGMINLATAHFLLGEFIDARAVIDKAHQQNPDSSVVSVLRALILYEHEKEIDMWPLAIKILKKQAVDENPVAIFNLARLFEERGRNEEAKSWWQRLINTQGLIPEDYWLIACEKIGNNSNCKNRNRIPESISVPMQIPIAIGADTDNKKVRREFSNWKKHQQKIGDLSLAMYDSGHGDSYLSVDHRLAVATVKQHSFGNTDALLERVGEPQMKLLIGSDELWSYGNLWAAVVTGGLVREIWIGKSIKK